MNATSTLGAPRDEQAVFDDLRALTQRRGFIHALAYIAVMDQTIFYGGDFNAEALHGQYDRDRLISTELAVLSGLWAQTERDVAHVESDALGELIHAAYGLMEEMHRALTAPLLKSVRDMVAGTQASEIGKGTFFREAIFYGPLSAFPFQFRALAVERYAQDTDWLRRNMGFDMEQAARVSQAIGELANRQLADLRRRLAGAAPRFFSPLEAVSVRTVDIATTADMDEGVVASVLAAFGLMTANTAYRAIDDYNEARSRPLLAFGEGHFFVPDTGALDQALYESPIFWMRADHDYLDTANTHRGAFTESFVANYLRRSFGATHVYANVVLKKGNDELGEIDVLAVLGDRCVIVQCKAKGLTIKARQGNESALDGDFQAAIADAYKQAVSCGQLLLAGDVEALLPDGTPLKLKERPSAIYPICVVADHYPALSSQVRALLSLETIHPIRQPFVMDVFVLDVVTEMLDTPLRLLSYIDQHAKAIDRVIVVHELPLLAFHLRYNLWVKPDMGIHIDDSVAAPLDAAMMVRRMGLQGTRAPPGILTRFVGTPYERLIAQLEGDESTTAVDLGLMLLQMPPATVDEINNGLRRLLKITQRKGGQHDFSILLGRSGSGLTVHVNERVDQPARDKLLSHSELKKHQQRGNEWYALLLDRDGRLRFAAVTRTPYQASEETDRLANVMLPPTPPSRTVREILAKRSLRTKLGANDPCFCGSGKKYKRCHLFGSPR